MYIVMAKPRQEHSSTSFFGQAGIETYYPEVKECIAVGGGVAFVVRAFPQAISLRGLTMSESLEGSHTSSVGRTKGSSFMTCPN